MALTPSGTISLGNINTALSRGATAPISMNDAQVRFLANQDSGSVNMNAMRNRYNNNGTFYVQISFGKYADIYYGTTSVGGLTGGFFDGGMSSIEVIYGEFTNGTQLFSSYDALPAQGSVPNPVPPNGMRLKIGSNAPIVMPPSGTSAGNGVWFAENLFAIPTIQTAGQLVSWQWTSL